MKITYIRLENFIGIFNGTGKYVYEIDFAKVKTKNNIVLLQGENGTGKTTVLSCLHPFSGTMDDRTEIIIEGKDGYKEIHFKKNKDLYVIKHNYLNKRKNKAVKSYISKNGEELNENGTVKSFEEIVSKELDVNPSFFILSRIGSNVKNFIGLKPAERKNYMSKFLPDISQFLLEYKKMNEKYLYINKKIKSIIAEIDKLDDEEALAADKQRLTKLIKKSKKLLDSYMQKINVNKGVLSTLDIDDITTKYETAIEKIKKAEKNFRIVQEQFDENMELLEMENEIDEENIRETLESLLSINRKHLLDTEVKLSEFVTLLTSVTKEVETYKSELSKLKEELKSYKLKKDISEFREMKVEYENKLKMIKKKMKNFDDKYKLDVDDEEISIVQQFFKHIQEDVIFNDYDMNTVTTFQENFTKYSTEYFASEKEKLKKKISTLTDDITVLNREISFYESKKSLSGILDNRPKECKIDSCKFIYEALKYANAQDEITKDEEELAKKKSELSKLKNKLEFLEDLGDYFFNFNRLYKEVQAFASKELLKSIVPDYFDSKEHFLSFITCDKNKFIDEFQTALEYAHLFMDKNETESTLKEIEHNITILESRDKLISKTEASIKEKEEKIESGKADIIKYRESISEFTSTKEGFTEDIANLEEAIKCCETHAKLIIMKDKYETIKSNLEEDMETINRCKKENDELMSVWSDERDIHDEHEKELEDVKYKIKRLEEFKKELEYSNERFNNVSIIRNALSPTKGIPLLFVDIYLKQTRNIANELLDYAFGGKFYIEEFKLTESDFFIKVIKENGIPIKDVTLTSQGEMSLIGLAISFAMIKQAKKKYNVLLIDEMDKELDSDRRRFFVDILEKQLEVMGIEQCFIISHNKEFDTSDLDLLLFKGHDVDLDNDEYMKGKHVFK